MKYRSHHINYYTFKSTSQTSYFYKTASNTINHIVASSVCKATGKITARDMRDWYSGFDIMTVVDLKKLSQYLVYAVIFRRDLKEI